MVLGAGLVLSVASLAGTSAFDARSVEAAEWGRTILGMLGGLAVGFFVARAGRRQRTTK
jgi:hypothetical protein